MRLFFSVIFTVLFCYLDTLMIHRYTYPKPHQDSKLSCQRGELGLISYQTTHNQVSSFYGTKINCEKGLVVPFIKFKQLLFKSLTVKGEVTSEYDSVQVSPGDTAVISLIKGSSTYEVSRILLNLVLLIVLLFFCRSKFDDWIPLVSGSLLWLIFMPGGFDPKLYQLLLAKTLNANEYGIFYTFLVCPILWASKNILGVKIVVFVTGVFASYFLCRQTLKNRKTALVCFFSIILSYQFIAAYIGMTAMMLTTLILLKLTVFYRFQRKNQWSFWSVYLIISFVLYFYHARSFILLPFDLWIFWKVLKRNQFYNFCSALIILISVMHLGGRYIGVNHSAKQTPEESSMTTAWVNQLGESHFKHPLQAWEEQSLNQDIVDKYAINYSRSFPHGLNPKNHMLQVPIVWAESRTGIILLLYMGILFWRKLSPLNFENLFYYMPFVYGVSNLIMNPGHELPQFYFLVIMLKVLVFKAWEARSEA